MPYAILARSRGPNLGRTSSPRGPTSHCAASARPRILATTYYFYWHDLTDPDRLGRQQGRFHVPPGPAHYSFLLPETHQREFSDMLAAGLDFVLPVDWGEPGHPGRTTSQTAPHYWSTEGIPPMVEALQRNEQQGAPSLQIGMFYDTTIMANADLTTTAGKEYFYVNVRDFYSRIPPRYWAAIDGLLIVWLYDTIWISKFDQSSIDYLSARFSSDFNGLRLFVVRESQWQTSKGVVPESPVTSDGLYAWGAAPFGFNTSPELTIAQVGPGFKNTQYCTGRARAKLLRRRSPEWSALRGAVAGGSCERPTHPGSRDVERIQRGDGHRGDGRDGAAVHRAHAAVRGRI